MRAKNAASNEAYPSVTSANEPCVTIRPRLITTTSSAVSAVSVIRWLESSTVRPAAAWSRSNCRIQRIPAGSSPFTGSSSTSTRGSPSRAAAMPSRRAIPSENVFTRPRAAPARPTRSRTSATRVRGIRLDRAIHARWSTARRSGTGPAPSSSAPTVRNGWLRSRYRFPSINAVPLVGASRPSRTRSVLDLPAPFGPRKPVTRPGRAVKLTSSTAVVRPYRLLSREISIMPTSPQWVD